MRSGDVGCRRRSGFKFNYCNMDDSQDIDRQLVDAVRRDDIEKTKHLLEKEASVNARNEQFYVSID